MAAGRLSLQRPHKSIFSKIIHGSSTYTLYCGSLLATHYKYMKIDHQNPANQTKIFMWHANADLSSMLWMIWAHSFERKKIVNDVILAQCFFLILIFFRNATLSTRLQ